MDEAATATAVKSGTSRCVETHLPAQLSFVDDEPKEVGIFFTIIAPFRFQLQINLMVQSVHNVLSAGMAAVLGGASVAMEIQLR